MGTVYRTKLNNNGRMLIPVEYRKKLGIRENEELFVRVDDQGLHIAPLIQHLRAFRTQMRENLPSKAKLLDQLRQLRIQDVE